jgi:hypothetical protein
MLQVFYLDIADVLQWLQMCSPVILYVCCKCFNCFGHMLQVFHLDVAKVDLKVAHVTLRPIGSSQLLARLHAHGCGGGATMRARDMKRCGPPCRYRTRCKCGTWYGMGPTEAGAATRGRPDVQAPDPMVASTASVPK